MLLVNARAGPSRIHGIGLIAHEFIPAGTRVWTFAPGFDLAFTESEVQALSATAQVQVRWYAYYDPRARLYVLSSDDDRFTNHSNEANTTDEELTTYAAGYAVREIEAGEEITWDYRLWGGLDFR